jgi:glycosyltransferase involved in cell wall biosynthesis
MFDAAFPPPVVGGKEKQAFLLSKYLKQKGIKVEAFSYFHNNNNSCSIENIIIKRINKKKFLFQSFFYLFYKRFNFSILHIHTPSRVGILVFFWGIIFRYKIFFKFPGQNIIEDSSGIMYKIFMYVLKHSKRLVILENKTYKKILSLNIDKNKIFYTYNGVELNKIKIYTEGDKKEFKILFVGRLCPIKRCGDIIKACALLDVTKINWRVDFVGEGALEDELNCLVKKMNLTDRIFFHGRQDNVGKFLFQSNVLVLPSESEGMSNVILEAMSIGLPIIATNVGAILTQLGYDSSDFLIDVGDYKKMSYLIHKLYSNPTLQMNYGKYLYKRCQKKFSMDIIAHSYIKEYTKIC